MIVYILGCLFSALYIITLLREKIKKAPENYNQADWNIVLFAVIFSWITILIGVSDVFVILPLKVYDALIKER